MPDHRPRELVRHLESAAEKNDTLILEALSVLEDPARRGKRKATVAAICEMTALSRNTVRSRAWAIERLKKIKQSHKAAKQASESQSSRAQSEPTPSMLRARIKRILEQNAVLYEEVLSLKDTLERKDREIAALKARKNLTIVP